MPQIIVTTYRNPDLDGLACSYAYAELLRKKGAHADYFVSGSPFAEAMFAAGKAKVRIKKSAETKGAQFVLVDASFLGDLSPEIIPERVVEIIDHRKFNEAHAFRGAKLQIELVGSCATLVTEKFMKWNIPMSSASRLLLFYAIASNTINFKANVTTSRDKKAAQWLKRGLQLKKSWLQEFFSAKSEIRNVRKAIEDDSVVRVFGGRKFVIGQLEIAGAREFAASNGKQIRKTLEMLEKKNSAGLSFLVIIDIEKAADVFYTGSSEIKEALGSVLKLKFSGNTARSKSIIMRKELSPLLDEYFRKTKCLDSKCN